MHWSGLLKRERQGMAAICLDGQRLYAAGIRRAQNAMPTVTFWRSVPLTGSPATMLAELRRDLHLDRYHRSTVLPTGAYRMLVIEAPAVPEAERNEALRWQLKGQLDFPAEDAMIDSIPVAGDLSGGPHRNALHVFAAARQAVSSRAELFAGAHMPLDVVDVAELALRNVAGLFAEPGMGVALARFGVDASGVAFVAGGELCMYRSIDTTTEDLTQSLLSHDGRVLERIELALQRSIDHFERHFSSIPVPRMLFVPGPGVDALVDYLSSRLTLAVALAEPRHVLDMSGLNEPPERLWQTDALIALGAALREDA